MNEKVRHRDIRTVSELRLWADRARRNHATSQNEDEILTLSDATVLVVYSLINISRLMEELSEECRECLPLFSREKLRQVEDCFRLNNPELIRRISSVYIDRINDLDSHLEAIYPSKFN